MVDTAAMHRAEDIAALLINGFQAGNKLMICGNGGSAADASHIAAEFMGRFKRTRRPLPAIALTDPAAITCIANDFGFDQVFSRQVEALAQPGDVLIAISTSGNSENVLRAVRAAKVAGVITVAFTGMQGHLRKICSYVIEIDSVKTAEIQEGYMRVAHEIADRVESVINQTRDAA